MSYVRAFREDFIGNYIGQTSEKTEKFLKRHLGLTIYVCEGDLCFNDGDSFGKEALSTLNSFITKNNYKITTTKGSYKIDLF